MEFVSIDTWVLIFTWVNLIILFFIMKKLLFKPIMNVIQAREAEVSEMYKKAETAQQSAQELEAQYTQKLAEAKDEAGRIVKDATVTATKRGEEIVLEAQKKAAAAISKAECEIEREKKAAVDEIKGDIASLAVSAAEKIIERDINESDYERLVEEFIKSSGEVK